MRKIALAAMGMLMLATSATAAILDFKSLSIDFCCFKDATAKATWATPEHLQVTADGLGWDGEVNSLRDGWIQTKPQALGLSWRPASAVSVRVQMEPAPQEFALPNGQRSRPDAGDVYVRYSPDTKHWSSWQVLQRSEAQSTQEKESGGRFFGGQIRVPYAEMTEYRDLVQKYSRMDVPWVSDEEAAVRWILKEQPDFFERHLPFIGYVEFLYEGGFYGGQRIRTFNATISYGLSGIHQPPKDPSLKRYNDSSPWSFVAE